MWCNTAAPRRLTVALLATLACAAHAQSRGTLRVTSSDSVFARARQLVVSGNGAAGRVLVDSMVAATAPDTPAYAEALFWRAALAATDVDAERDYRRIVVEYSLSPRASQAAFQLAQLEAARGDRASAATHLERYLLENPNSADRGRAGLLLVRLSFEQNDVQRGCIALGRAMSVVPASEVEMRNQLDYYAPRCAGVDTTGAPSPVVTPLIVAPSAPKPRSGLARTKRSASVATQVATGRFTLQVAAYTSRADAVHLVKRLKARGIDARVVSSATLFRVRIGRFETRAAAAATEKTLKAKKIAAFVTEAGANDK